MSDPTIEYHVVIACPPHWGESTARTLADRLVNDELPEGVGVYVWRIEEGKIAAQDVIRNTDDEA